MVPRPFKILPITDSEHGLLVDTADTYYELGALVLQIVIVTTVKNLCKT